MNIIKCIVFKSSGKYYTDEAVIIPDGIQDWDIPDRIREGRMIPDMYYMGYTMKHEVPFLVKPDR